MLLIDVGNTRIKWAYSHGQIWQKEGAAPLGDWATLQDAFATLAPPRRILVCNVAGDNAAQQVRDACAGLACPVEFVTAQESQCGVRNGYAEPGRLGCDRWASLIAAWRLTGAACLAVNCGTATTIDALSPSGEFLGGLILPGIDMMVSSLSRGTAQVTDASGRWQTFPRNTGDAVASGAIQATVGAVRQQYELLAVPGAACVLSGGAAEKIEALIRLPVTRVDNLVLQGLQIIGEETAAC